MEYGGIKTKWLFPDMLEPGKRYVMKYASEGFQKSRDGKTSIPFLVFIGAAMDGIVAEYQISAWRIESKEKFSPLPDDWFAIARHGTNFFLEKVNPSP